MLALSSSPSGESRYPIWRSGTMTTELNEEKLHAFVGKMLGDVGGGMSVPTVRLGFRLGLFEALAGGPATARELAARAGGLHERYVREWALARSEAHTSELQSLMRSSYAV